MTAYYDPGYPEFAEEDGRVLAAEISGRSRLYGQDSAIGRRLPELFHNAGLREIVLEGMFHHSVIVPCDRRVEAAWLENVLSEQLKQYSDRVKLDEYRRLLRTGGLASKEINRNMKVSKEITKQRIRALRQSSKAKESDTSFTAIPFFLAIGRNLQSTAKKRS
jgi:hypothetical protein